MKQTLTLGFAILSFMIWTNVTFCQSSLITKLSEDKAFKYQSYHDNGQIEKEIGFYSRKPYKSIEEFEAKLKVDKIKNHGASKEFYSNGQLKEIVVYRKGKVIETMKNYFEDGEEFYVVIDEFPTFQFKMDDQKIWFSQQVKAVEKKYKVDLEGTGFIALEISKDGTVNSVKIPSTFKENEKYLLEIGEQIQVVKPAIKNGKEVGTKFGFKIQF